MSKIIAESSGFVTVIPFKSIKRNTTTTSKQVECKKTLKRLNKYEYTNYHKMYDDDLSTFRKYLKDPKHKEEMSAALNEKRESLLHLTCQYDEPEHIEELINLKCSVFKQDFYGRTPLHVAIQRNHYKCIEQFVILLKSTINNKKNEQEELVESLRKMFRVYNHDGYTILHLAVLNNMQKVVEVMLEFCLKFKINVLESEVLGSGDSILHLAVKKNLKSMEKFIIDNVRDSVNHPNYSGSMPYCENTI